MKTRITAARATAALAVALAASLAAAAPTLSTEYRYASQLNEYFVRGDAAVSESAQFRKGLRLAAWDAQEQDDATRVAVATAAYFFQVPLAARSVAIEVAYQADPIASNKQVAGFLFVRNKAVEDQFAGENKDGNRPIEEPGFFGNTYLLPADQQRVSVTLPTENHVVDGVLEVHLSAGAGQVFDAQYVQVTAFGVEVLVPIQYVEPAAYLPNPYDYSYYYYYAGPCYYPYGSYYACFQLTSFDPIFWHQWTLRRAAYFLYRPWCYRPAHYSHWPFLAVHRPTFAVRPHLDRYRDDWYRRCFQVDPDRVHRDDFDHLIRRRRDFLPPERVVEQQRVARELVDKGQAAERQVRDRFGDPGALWRRNPAELTHAFQSLRNRDDFAKGAQAWANIQAARRPHFVGTAQGAASTSLSLDRRDSTTRSGFPSSPTGQLRRDIPLPTTPIVPRSLELPPVGARNPRLPATLGPDSPSAATPPTEHSRSQTLRDRFQQLLQGGRALGPSSAKDAGPPGLQDSPPLRRRSENQSLRDTLPALPDVKAEPARQPRVGPFLRLEQPPANGGTPSVGPVAPKVLPPPAQAPENSDEPKRKPRGESPPKSRSEAPLLAPKPAFAAPVTLPPTLPAPQVKFEDNAARRLRDRDGSPPALPAILQPRQSERTAASRAPIERLGQPQPLQSAPAGASSWSSRQSSPDVQRAVPRSVGRQAIGQAPPPQTTYSGPAQAASGESPAGRDRSGGRRR